MFGLAMAWLACINGITTAIRSFGARPSSSFSTFHYHHQILLFSRGTRHHIQHRQTAFSNSPHTYTELNHTQQHSSTAEHTQTQQRPPRTKQRPKAAQHNLQMLFGTSPVRRPTLFHQCIHPPNTDLCGIPTTVLTHTHRHTLSLTNTHMYTLIHRQIPTQKTRYSFQIYVLFVFLTVDTKILNRCHRSYKAKNKNRVFIFYFLFLSS